MGNKVHLPHQFTPLNKTQTNPAKPGRRKILGLPTGSASLRIPRAPCPITPDLWCRVPAFVLRDLALLFWSSFNYEQYFFLLHIKGPRFLERLIACLSSPLSLIFVTPFCMSDNLHKTSLGGSSSSSPTLLLRSQLGKWTITASRKS